jgi:hypothetical protein
MDEADETFEEASAWYDDPANQLLCGTCGWTLGMICPECAKGCGCETSCTGWRHAEYAGDDDLDPSGGGVDVEFGLRSHRVDVGWGQVGAGGLQLGLDDFALGPPRRPLARCSRLCSSVRSPGG